MTKGKLAVQAAHASIGAFNISTECIRKQTWFGEGQRKIAFKVASENHLQYLLYYILNQSSHCFLSVGNYSIRRVY